MYDDLLGPRPTIKEKRKLDPPQSSPNKPQSSPDKESSLKNMVATEATEDRANSDEDVDQWADVEDLEVATDDEADCDGKCDQCDSGEE